MRKIIIAILLLTGLTAQSQTKWRQIERSLTKWNVPAAYDSIPGQAGYAGKWISLQTLIDTIGIETGGVKGTGVANRVAYWVSSDSLTSNANLTFTSGNIFTLIGRMVLKATTTVGDWNAFINGGNTTLTGNGNIAIGSNQTFVNATTADNNILLGPVAGNQLTTGDNNIFLGANTGQQNTTSSNNTYVGHTSGVYNTGADNTYIGSGSGHTATNVSNNTYVGSNAGYNATNSNNVYMGFYSGFASTNSGTFNVAIGNEASKDGGGSYNVKLGALAGNGNTGSNNVFLGYDSGRTSSTKSGNIFIGYQSGRNEDIDNSLIISNSPSTSNGIYGDFDNSKFGVNIAPASAARTWDINGELRIRDLTTDNPTKLLGADNDGDVSGITIGSGLTVSGTTLSASSSIFYPAYGTLYRTNNISYDSLTDTPIIIDFNALDTFGIAGNVTSNELTISTTGKYRIEYSGAFSTDTPYVASVRFEVYKNGSSIGYEGECRTRNLENGSDNINHYSRSFIVSLSAGDDISLYYFEPSFPTVRTLILMQNVNLIIQRIN